MVRIQPRYALPVVLGLMIAGTSGAQVTASATDSAAARAYFGDRVACYLDGGPRRGSAVSSVVEFLKGLAILRRAGAVEARRLASIVTFHTSEN